MPYCCRAALAAAALAAVPVLAFGELTMQDVLTEEALERSVVNEGDPARLMRVFDKARRGEAVTVGSIGGSITQGASASTAENRWANRVAQWWRETFPRADVRLVNAGIGATGSNIGAHRVQKHLLDEKPDIVFVEYAVNDSINPIAGQTLEGLLRQILAQEQRPAAVLLYTMNRDGENMADIHTPVGKHYGLPIISYRDAVFPAIEAGRITWEDISPDDVHPNDLGHAMAAGVLTSYLAGVLGGMSDDAPPPPPLPAPLHTGRYENARMLTAEDIQPNENRGWEPCASPLFGTGWRATQPGSKLVFELDADAISVLFYRVKGDMGVAEAWVDDGEPVQMDAWFNADWGGFTPFQLVGDDLGPGPHKLTIRLTDATHPNSNGHAFEVRGVMAAGSP